MNGRIVALAILVCGFAGCGNPKPGVDSTDSAASRDEIPSSHLNEVIAAHYRGLGAMERYEYGMGIESFREVHRLAPGWIPGSINLAIALLNEGGEAAEEAKDADRAKSEGIPRSNMDQAVRLLDDVLARHSENLSALFCKGIILEFQGNLAEAHALFGRVVALDPYDANAWLEFGSTLTDPADPTRPAGPSEAKALVDLYYKALERNPYLVPAMFKLQTAYGWAGDRDGRAKLLAKWEKLNPKRNAAGSGDLAAQVYGEMGKHARIVNPFPRSIAPEIEPPSPRFAPPEPIAMELPTGHRWSVAADFVGPTATLGRARARFGAGVTTFDANGDGRLDLYLTAAVVGPQGLRDTLLIQGDKGQFVDSTAEFGLPLDRAGIGAGAADFDADRRIDLFLTGVGDQRLLKNVGKRFVDVTDAARIDRNSTIAVGARWLDLDQDGDLDLYVINHARASDAGIAFGAGSVSGVLNVAYRNDGQAAPISGRPQDNYAPLAVATADLPATTGLSIAFSTSWPGAEVLGGGSGSHSAIAALDVDEDRDVDLILASDGKPLKLLLNDRGGEFHEGTLEGIKPESRVDGLLTADFDKNGRVDLLSVSARGQSTAWLNPDPSTPKTKPSAWTQLPLQEGGWVSPQVADLDFDMWPDLIGAQTGGKSGALTWARNAEKRFESKPLALGPDGAGSQRLQGFAFADLTGDHLPDFLLIGAGGPPRLSRNLGNGNHWLAIELGGRWKTSFDQMRTNSQGIGTRLTLEGQGIHVPFDYLTPTAGPSQSVGPCVLGLGSNPSAPLLRVRWPDGVMQCELNVTVDKLLALTEVSRKTGSCPVLFTWNGSRFECLGDFLGGGGLGYLVAPGTYGQPDRDESVAITADQLRDADGTFRLSVVEPMDEVAYLDHLRLDVVDAPPGITTVLDERFAPEGLRPSGKVIATNRQIDPVRAVDGVGVDQTEAIRSWDRSTVDNFRRLRGWVGYTEEHSLTLDFANRLADTRPGDRTILCLAGWVEYPYSQTNYAAATAGVTLRPPVLERQKTDGTWEIIDAHPDIRQVCHG